MEKLIIADGTDYRIAVKDVRADYVWANPSWKGELTQHKRLFLHHTAAPYNGRRIADEVAYLVREADGAPYGLPYNFVIFPRSPYRIYYLNDVDVAYPHTYAHNDDCAIAAAGNYQELPAPIGMVRRIGRWADAMRSMWGNPGMVMLGHRDVFPTACPGDYLYAALPDL